MHTDGPIKDAMLEAGAAAYLSKHADLHEVLKKVRKLGGTNGKG